MGPPLGKILRIHDGKAAAAAAAVIDIPCVGHRIDPVLRHNGIENGPLRFFDTHQADDVAGIVHRDRKVVLTGVKLYFAACHNIGQNRQATFTRNRQIADADPVTNRHRRLGGMSTFTNDNLADPQTLGRLDLSDQNFGELHIIVPNPVINSFITHRLRRKRPVNSSGIKQNGESRGVFRPGQKFSGVMQQ